MGAGRRSEMSKLLFPQLEGHLYVQKMKRGRLSFRRQKAFVTLDRSNGSIYMFQIGADPSKAEPLYYVNMQDDVSHVDYPEKEQKFKPFTILVHLPREKAFCLTGATKGSINSWLICLQ